MSDLADTGFTKEDEHGGYSHRFQVTLTDGTTAVLQGNAQKFNILTASGKPPGAEDKWLARMLMEWVGDATHESFDFAESLNGLRLEYLALALTIVDVDPNKPPASGKAVQNAPDSVQYHDLVLNEVPPLLLCDVEIPGRHICLTGHLPPDTGSFPCDLMLTNEEDTDACWTWPMSFLSWRLTSILTPWLPPVRYTTFSLIEGDPASEEFSMPLSQWMYYNSEVGPERRKVWVDADGINSRLLPYECLIWNRLGPHNEWSHDITQATVDGVPPEQIAGLSLNTPVRILYPKDSTGEGSTGEDSVGMESTLREFLPTINPADGTGKSRLG